MKTLALATAILFGLAISIPTVVFSPADAKITKVNGGGQTPKGEANGIPSKNPAGKEPKGHNK